jgi:ubiquitin carboxyl-terminal hydrolase 5/13
MTGFVGIDIMKTEKTEKTLSELEVELNQSYDWSKILDGNEEIEMMDGPGFKGLRNIGSSCYMNAVVQTMLAVQEVCDDDDDHDE